jgi:hypothetical protein
MGFGSGAKNSDPFFNFSCLPLQLFSAQYLMKQVPILTPQQKAQILGDSPTTGNPLADMDLRVFLKIARKMHCREYPHARKFLKRHNACIHCGRPSEIIALSMALNCLEGDLQTLIHQIKPLIEATRILLGRLRRPTSASRKGK